jgi:hypothetical protein
MPIITISRGSYSNGKAVAERVAECLGIGCISREVLLEASEHFNVPEIKLLRALHDAPSFLQRLTFGKERYLTYFAAAFLQQVQPDNVIYHGLAGHFYVRGVSHVLKVRIIADMESRVRLEMEREQVTEEEALARVNKDDQQRRRWSRYLFGVDTWDPSLYDLVVHVHKLTVDDAADLICRTAGLSQFQATPESQRILDDLVLAARVKARLIEVKPQVTVSARGGRVLIHSETPEMLEPGVVSQLEKIAAEVSGVTEVVVHDTPQLVIG